MTKELEYKIQESNKAVKRLKEKGYDIQGWSIAYNKVYAIKDGKQFSSTNYISLAKSLGI